MTSESPQLEPLNVRNLPAHVAERVRRTILKGTYKLGERLVESAIADQLGVSRAPVREALASLEQEGIVAKVPRRGYFVVDFSDKDVEEVYSLRLLLETEALRRTISRISEPDLAELQCIVNELGDAAVQRTELENIVAPDLSFHQRICYLADHSRLFSAWENLRIQTHLLICLTSQTYYDDPYQPREWHQRIMDSIKTRNSENAQLALADHLFDAQRRARKALQAQKSG